MDVIEWIKKGVGLGVGEILVTSIDQDGTLKGYDLDLIKVSDNVDASSCWWWSWPWRI